MRILSGTHAGRHLTSPGRKVRPTPEAVRDRLLDLLSPEIREAEVLDLFAGSGALGLEALSRGADRVDFVENGPAALHALKANVAALREGGRSRIFKRDVIRWIDTLEEGRYAVAFVDPPYGSRKLDRVLERWRVCPFSDVLVLEHDRAHPLDTSGLRSKRYDFTGPTRVTIVRR
jgi:16S rRNA (guanine966-N2)-methyltransferase